MHLLPMLDLMARHLSAAETLTEPQACACAAACVD